MLDTKPVNLPDFKMLFDSEVYTIDFLAGETFDLCNPDPNALRRGFLVLSRYGKPTVSEVTAYLQKIIEQQMAYVSRLTLDEHLSPLIAALADQDVISLLKGDSQMVRTFMSDDLVVQEKDGQQYLQAHYFTMPAPLYIQQGKKIKDPEWYHDAFADRSLRENGLQRWFLIRMNYAHLLDPEKVTQDIHHSPIIEKDGTVYVMNNICKQFSQAQYFARIKDSTARKVKEAALEVLLHLQKERDNDSLLYSPKADINSN